MTATNSCPDPASLQALVDGSLPEPEQAALTAHLETCTTCQDTLQQLVAGSASWANVASQLDENSRASEPGLKDLLARLKATVGVGETASGNAPSELSLDFLDPADKPGQMGRLNHYEILEVLGHGAMGVVFKAFDPKLHRVVAIKALAPQLATTAAARKRFEREAKAAAAVSHDHVIAIHSVEEANGIPYIVMSYVQGSSLQQRLDQTGPLDVKEILRIGMQIAQGLAAAHAQGLVHRDIKPSNVLLENGIERVKITDFGLARAVDDATLTQSGVIAGTPQYMAPEQARGEAIDHRADLFSLGSVLYALCTGRPPFRASTVMGVLKRVSEESPRPIRDVNPDVPDWLCAIIGKLHAKSPGERYQTALEVAELLERCLAHVQQPASVVLPLAVREALPVGDATPAMVPSPALPKVLPRLRLGALLLLFLCSAYLALWFQTWWAFAITGAGLVGLTIFAVWLEHRLMPKLRAQTRGWGEPSDAPRPPRRWPRIAQWALLALVILVAIAVWGNAVGKLKHLFYHELVIDVPELDVVVEVWETDDRELVEGSTRKSFTGAWPLEPRATITSGLRRLRLPPGNYWILANKGGKRLEEHLIAIGWGGSRTIVVGELAKAPSRLNGRWLLHGAEFQGHKMADKDALAKYPSELGFHEDQYVLVWGGVRHEGKVRIDASTWPAAIDFTGSGFDGPKPRQGIFEIIGEDLRLCLEFIGANADPPRPSTFLTTPDSNNVTLTYRRAEIPGLADFQRVVAIRETKLRSARERHEAGIVPLQEVLASEFDWLEARFQLADVQGKREDARAALEAIVANRVQNVERLKQLFNAGKITDAGVSDAEAELAKARARLARMEAQ